MLPRRRRFAWGLVLACACGSEPSIDVHTSVGGRFEDRDPARQREMAWTVLETALPEWLGALDTTPAPPSDPQTPAPPPHPPRTEAELEALVQAIERGPLHELPGPARRLAAASPELWPRIRTALLAERKAPKTDYRALLAAIGGDVPNRYGHFERAWKKAHGHDVRLSEDWFEDLLALPRGTVSEALLPVYRDCVLETAWLRAAGRIGRQPEHTAAVVETLLSAAYLHHGTFRDEVGRAMLAIGDEALPSLVRAMAQSTSNDAVVQRQAAYAEHLLGRMDRLHPRRAMDAVRDEPRLLAALLAAYADTRLGEAAEVLLDLIDDRGAAVRTEARRGFEALVHGPLPDGVRKTVRLLGGGTAQARAASSPRQRATAALEARLEAEAPDLLEPRCALRRENGTPDTACEGRTARMTAAYFAWLDARRKARGLEVLAVALAETDLERGAALVDPWLADDAALQGDRRVVELFARLGQTYEQGGARERAAAQYRKAAMLAGDAPVAGVLRVAALLNEARAEGLDRAGRGMLLETAAREAPEDRRVVRALARWHAEVPRDRFAGAALGVHVAALSVLLGLFAWLGGPLRRRFAGA